MALLIPTSESKVTFTVGGGITEQYLRIKETNHRGAETMIERFTYETSPEYTNRTMCVGIRRRPILVPPITYCTPAAMEHIEAPAVLSPDGDDDVSNKTERAVINCVNELRKNPELFILHLQNRLVRFVGTTMWTSSGALKTSEGQAPLLSLIEELRGLKSSLDTPLVESVGLCLAAADHANDIGSKGLVSHTGTDGTAVSERTSRYGAWEECVAELFALGVRDPLDIVCQLLIDDGVKSRCHRRMLLDAKYRFIGVAVVPHKGFGVCAVVTLAGSYTSLPRASLISCRPALRPSNSTCTSCLSLLDTKRCVYGLHGLPYHRHCFLCKVCKSLLHDVFFEWNGAPYCADCVVFRSSVSCSKCSKKLTHQKNATQDVSVFLVNSQRTCEECFLSVAGLLHTPCSSHKQSEAT